MRTAYEEDEEELEPLPSQQDRELTLSSTTLLAFFFGLVLVCGLFFGLGYTLGRRSPSSNTPDSVQAAGPASGSAGALPVSEARPKPSAAAQPVTATPSAPDPAPQESQTPDSGSVIPPTPAPDDKSAARPIAKDAPTPQPKPVVQPALPSSPQPVAATSPGVMVQIAAVSNPADADVLVKALQKRGYSVTVRHDPSDAFLHVQVGPFATRTEANAMRQKLTSDGYNAILK